MAIVWITEKRTGIDRYQETWFLGLIQSLCVGNSCKFINFIWKWGFSEYILFPWGICLQYRRPAFDPWVGKIPWRRERPVTPVFWTREFHGLCSPWGSKVLDTNEWLSLWFSYILSSSISAWFDDSHIKY